jgi:hypothetical protein
MNHYFPARVPEVKPPADFAARAGRYAGRYGAIRHSYTRFEKIFGLFGGAAVAPTDKDTLVIPDIFGHSAQYAEVAPGVFRELRGDRTVAFVENGAGQVVGMVGQFAFIPFAKLRWYESQPFHYALLALSLLFFLIALVSALRHWKSDKAGPSAARWARRNLGLVALLNLAFLVGFAAIVAAGVEELIFATPRGLYAVLTLPLIGLALTVLAVVLAVRVWRERFWTRGARLFHTAGVVAAVAFVWFLNYWNLLGYRVG